MAALVRAQLNAIDSNLPPGDADTLQDLIDTSIAQPRFRTMLVGAFATIALLLAAVGVYGLISYSVAQRTREIGIRVALGAQPRQVLVQIMGEGVKLAVVGIGVGLLSALVAGQAIATFLFGVPATDPLTLGSVAALLLAVAALATYIPSRRALGVDPLTALRSD